MMSKKKCIVIGGPTASGKTALAIEVAKYFQTAVLSADSRQCYQELTIGSAKPSEKELLTVPHYFINSHTIQNPISVGDFATYAENTLAQHFKNANTIVICGGSGLYLQALIHGLDEIPTTPIAIRNQLQTLYEQHGITVLQNMLKEKDADAFRRIDQQNPHRLLRALGVFLSTGKSIFSFHKKPAQKFDDYEFYNFYLEIDRNNLYERINNRVDEMIALGLEEEVKNLQPFKHTQALQTVGYKEFFDYFENKISREKTIELIKQHTRNYAKRQITWFKNSGDYTPIRNEKLNILKYL